MYVRNKGYEVNRRSHQTIYSMASSYTPMGACHLGGSRFTETNLSIEDSFSPGIRSVLGAARQFFNQITPAASDACEFRSPTSSRGDNGVVGLTPWHSVRAPLRSHVPLAGRVMSAVYPPSEFAGFSFKNPAPMPGVAELDAGRETREQMPVLVVAGSQIAKLVERDSGCYQLRQVGKPSRAGNQSCLPAYPPSCGGVPRFMGVR